MQVNNSEELKLSELLLGKKLMICIRGSSFGQQHTRYLRSAYYDHFLPADTLTWKQIRFQDFGFRVLKTYDN